MGVWDSIKGGAGAAWDQTGGRVWDAHQRANEEGRIFGLNPDKGLYQGLDWWTNEMESVGDSILHGQEGRDPADDINIFTLGQAIGDQWRPTEVPPPDVAELENWGNPEAISGSARGSMDETVIPWRQEGGMLPTELAPPTIDFARPDFDPTAITGPYGDYTAAANQAFDKYAAMLEGISTGPRTSRIDEMYAMALAEARRRGESADTWEATETARLDASDEALDAALIDMQDKFGERLTTIREGSVERQAETADLRDGLIEATAGELGEAGAAFLVSATRTGDVLESQRSRNEQHMADMDGLYSMWSLDRTMDAAGMKQSARRDLADDVMAMREMIHQFSYAAGQERLERLQVAEENAAQRETDMLTTLAELGYGHAGQMADVGLQQDLAVAGAEDEFDTKWDEAEAYWSNPVTANAFMGVDPSLMTGAPPQQMFENWLAVLGTQDSGPSVGAPGDPYYWQDENGDWYEIGTYGPQGQLVRGHAEIGGVSGMRDESPWQTNEAIRRAEHAAALRV